MKLLGLILAPTLAALVGAQSAPGFPIKVEENLVVTYPDTNTDVSPPGVLLPRRDVVKAPTAYRPGGSGFYVLFLIDQDVTYNHSRVTFLHWLQPNLQASSGALTVVNIADGASTAVGAPYIPPSPPADSVAHSYTFIVFEQPSQWIIPSSYVTINPPADSVARIGFNITDFVAASGLGEPLAANYMRVLNGTAAESSSAATETYTAPASTQSVASSAATPSAPLSSSAMTSAVSGSGSATSAVASATASATDGAVAVRGNARELLVGLAMGVVGAVLWML